MRNNYRWAALSLFPERCSFPQLGAFFLSPRPFKHRLFPKTSIAEMHVMKHFALHVTAQA